MGDQPTEVDCAIFGQLCPFVWNMPKSPFEKLLNGELNFYTQVSNVYLYQNTLFIVLTR